jgi:hypothetical protein
MIMVVLVMAFPTMVTGLLGGPPKDSSKIQIEVPLPDQVPLDLK